MKECAILVLSCDKYMEQLKLIKESFDANWRDCNFKIYYGLEKSMMSIEGWHRLNSSNSNWAGRFLEYLKAIKEDLVLLILDDFYIENKVDNGYVNFCVNQMKSDEDIINITLESIPDKSAVMTDKQYMMRRSPKGNYLLNLQVGIWNKKYLVDLVKEKENPWQTEIYGSIRARKYKDKKFFCIDDDSHMPIPNGRGWLVVRGCWNRAELERLGLQNHPCVTSDDRPIKLFLRDQILVPRSKRIPEIIGRYWRILLAYLGIYF